MKTELTPSSTISYQLKEVVQKVKGDGGRFLCLVEGLWYEVADEVARKKASQGKWQTTLYVM